MNNLQELIREYVLLVHGYESEEELNERLKAIHETLKGVESEDSWSEDEYLTNLINQSNKTKNVNSENHLDSIQANIFDVKLIKFGSLNSKHIVIASKLFEIENDLPQSESKNKEILETIQINRDHSTFNLNMSLLNLLKVKLNLIKDDSLIKMTPRVELFAEKERVCAFTLKVDESLSESRASIIAAWEEEKVYKLYHLLKELSEKDNLQTKYSLSIWVESDEGTLQKSFSNSHPTPERISDLLVRDVLSEISGSTLENELIVEIELDN